MSTPGPYKKAADRARSHAIAELIRRHRGSYDTLKWVWEEEFRRRPDVASNKVHDRARKAAAADLISEWREEFYIVQNEQRKVVAAELGVAMNPILPPKDLKTQSSTEAWVQDRAVDGTVLAAIESPVEVEAHQTTSASSALPGPTLIALTAMALAAVWPDPVTKAMAVAEKLADRSMDEVALRELVEMFRA